MTERISPEGQGDNLDDNGGRHIPWSDHPIPCIGRIAGIDFGSVRIGLALSDTSQNWVSPLTTYTRRDSKLDGEYFLRLVEQENLVGWVVGLPIHCSGDESQKSAEARRFALWLAKRTDLPVALFDERFTTAEARRLLNETELSPKKKKQRLDGLAAHLILTHFLSDRGQERRGQERSEITPLDDLPQDD